MVPPEGIDKIAPTTLPADFGEWDSGENQEPKPVEVNGFDRFPAPPAPLKPAPKAPTARVAVLPAAERPTSAPPRKPARRYPEPEPVYERPKPQQNLDVDDDEEEDERKGKQKKMLIAVAAAALVLIGGGVGFWKMSSKPATPNQQVAQQMPANETPTTMGTTTIVTPPKPGAATTAATTTTPTVTPETVTPEPTPATSRQAEMAEMMNRQLNAPSRISNDLKALGASQAPTSGFSPNGMDMGNSTNVFAPGNGPKVKVESQKKVSISAGIAVGLLVQKTAPIYPSIAKSARISGTVVIQATISKNGTVGNPRVVSGPTMLRQAALDAVKSWRYRPYLLDGSPVEVDTTVNVVFNLGG